MPSLDVSTDIAASPERVWAAVEDISTHVRWMADAESITFTSGRTVGVGTTFECRTKLGPVRLMDLMEITEWEPRRTMGVRHSGVVTGTGRFTLTDIGDNEGDGTRFSWNEDLQFPWWLAGPLGAMALHSKGPCGP